MLDLRVVLIGAAVVIAAAGCSPEEVMAPTEPDTALRPKAIMPGRPYIDRFVSEARGLQLVFWDSTHYGVNDLYTGARRGAGEWRRDGGAVCAKRAGEWVCAARLDGDTLADSGVFWDGDTVWRRSLHN